MKLSFGRTNHAVCPVSAILAYLVVRGAQPGPLFLTQQGKPLTRHYFSSPLTTILGLPVQKFNTHSFRIGAATSAKQVQIPTYRCLAAGVVTHIRDTFTCPHPTSHSFPQLLHHYIVNYVYTPCCTIHSVIT